ncbi:MAG: preprotein translocase subunit SecE [Firmicutes bacterium]|nr:preprotein translocase subunit SecE [Bacillota bacterium]
MRNYVEATREYLREVRGELRRVIWPDRKQLVRLTAVVLVSSALVSLFIWAFDQAVSALMNLLVGNGR